MKLDEAVKYFLRTINVSPETKRSYENALKHLRDHLGHDFPLNQITSHHIVRWRRELVDTKRYENHPRIDPDRKRISVHSVRRIMGTSRTFFNWLVKMGEIEVSPATNVSRPKAPTLTPKAVTPSDFRKLLDTAGTYFGTKHEFASSYIARNTAVVLFLASTGCRVGGLCSARLATLEIEESSGRVDVTEKGQGGGKTRTVFLSEAACIALLEWLDLRPELPHDHIFTGVEGKSAGKPMTPRSVLQMLTRLAYRAGIKGRFNPHSFRHACAREWLNNGADLATVSQLLGHSSIQVTATHYARWASKELEEKHAEIDWAK